MVTLDGMDGMQGQDGPDVASAPPGGALAELALMVEHTRSATVNLAWLARHGDTPDRRLTPRGVVGDTLPSPGDRLKPQYHDAHVRATLYDFDLLSALAFEAGDNDTATLKYRAPGGGEPVPVMHITRPPLQVFRQQVLRVESQAQLRQERLGEILGEIGPQYALWTAVADLSPQRTPRTLELIDCGLRLSSSIVQRFKHQFVCPRPIEYSPLVQPVIQTPGHRSFPSGHSTQAFFVARLLKLLAGARCSAVMEEQLQAQAARIAQNREVAGVHFPVDSMAGCLLGDTLAWHLAAVGSQGEVTRYAGCFDARVHPTQLQHPGVAYGTFQHRGNDVDKLSKPRASTLAWLWNSAREEWA
jgi:hypothetical protein